MKRILGEAKNVRQLLASAKYSIDYYQRDYKWQPKQVLELVEDLTGRFLEDHEAGDARRAVRDYGHYFLGSIIISDKQGARYIVDGQQRLTTLTLFLTFLNNLQRELGFEGGDRVAVDELIFSTSYGERSFNLAVEDRVPVMTQLFDGAVPDAEGLPEGVANLVAQYETLTDAFPESLRGASLPFFLDWLTENVHLVEITAFSDEDAYAIFETMNDRGLSLSPIDMLKGYLLAGVQPDRREKANAAWKSRVGELRERGRDADADFFKAWFRSQHADTIREGKKDAAPGDFDRVGSEFHRWVRDAEERLGLKEDGGCLRFLQGDFDFYSRQYKRLADAGEQRTKGLESVYDVAQAGFTLAPMLLLAPLRLDDKQPVAEAKMATVATFLDILLYRRIWNLRSTAQSAMKYQAFRVTREIRGRKLGDLAEILRQELDADEESFAANRRFALHGMNRPQVQRIIARFTEHVEVGSGLESRYEEYTTRRGKGGYEVEHIWANKAQRHQDEFDHASDFAAYRNRVGGLVLLPKSFNASYGDLPYEKKLPHYLEQNLLVRSLHPQVYDHNPGFRKFIEVSGLSFEPHEQFNRADLDQRQELYLQLAERVWDPARVATAAGV